MKRIAWTGVLSVVFAAASGAQSSPIVTEAAFLAALDPSHPAVVEAAKELAVARARVVDARAFDNPTLEAVREDPEGSIHQLDVVVSWRLPDASRGPGVEAVEAAERAASARTTQRQSELRVEMRRVYATWALAVARRDRLESQAVRIETLAAREAERRDRGESSGLSAHRLTLGALALRSRVALAEAAAAEARGEAGRWLPSIPAEARPALPSLPTAPEASNRPPAIDAAEADLAAARLEQDAAGRFVASPELSVGWQRQELGPESTSGPLFGVAWSVPLFDRNQAERGAAEARVETAEARLELLQREVDATRNAARAAYDGLVRSVASAEAALAEDDRLLDGAEASFRLGETSLTDLLDTHRSVAEGHLALLDLFDAALAAHRELERLEAPRSTDIVHTDPEETTP